MPCRSIRVFFNLCCFAPLVSFVAIADQPTENPHSEAYRNRYGKLPPQPTVGDRMIADWVNAETKELAKKWTEFGKNLKGWDQQREGYRQQLLEMLGLDPLPEKTDLKATVTGRIDHPEFTVENLHFQSRPGLYCTANVYVPKGLESNKQPSRMPAILYLCGHGAVKENGISYGNKVHYQHHGAWFARNGYVCLVLDSVQLGEIEGKHHGTYRFDLWWWNSRGFTSAGPEAWNCVRALDYLQSREDVDPQKLGVTGRSGGGAYSWWIAAIDERIGAACPVAGITDLQNHAVDGCVEGHCDCMYMVNTYRWDYGMVAALVAPRPLLIGNTDKDSIFPLDGVMRIHARARDFYDYYDAPEKLGLAITEGGHVDTQELQMPVMRWFNKWLKGSDAPVINHAEKYFSPEQLRVFQTIPTDEITSRCHESFTVLARDEGPFDPQAAIASLKSKTFGAWPVLGRPNPSEEYKSGDRAYPIGVACKKLASQTSSQMQLTVYEFESQPEVDLRLYVLSPIGKKVAAVEFVLADDQLYANWMGKLVESFGEVLQEERARFVDGRAGEQGGGGIGWLDGLYGRGTALVVFSPRCTGWTSLGGEKKYQTHIRRRFMLLGMTIASSQVWDTLRAWETVRSLEAFRDIPMHLTAGDGLCEVAKFAVLYGPTLESCHIPSSFRDDINAPDFLNWSRIVTPRQLEFLVNSKMANR